MQRHHPGSEDNVGEDPLATSPAQSTKSPARNAFDSAGPIRLELGMDAEKLEKILDELEVKQLHYVIPFVWAVVGLFLPLRVSFNSFVVSRQGLKTGFYFPPVPAAIFTKTSNGLMLGFGKNRVVFCVS